MFKKFLFFLLFFLLPLQVFAASISTLTDNFDDNSIDAAKWASYADTGMTVLEVNQQIELTSAEAGGYAELTTEDVATYSLIGSQATVKIISAGNQALSSFRFRPLMLLATNDTNCLYFDIKAGGIDASYRQSGIGYDLKTETYVAATHKYLRIREASGTTYWDYSADGLSWTNMASIANPITETALLARMTLQSTAEASASTAKVDDFNILPRSRFIMVN